jgi:ubiquitin C-terminal hydrolase
VDAKIFKLGDITFKLGSIYRDILNRYIFLEINNPYNNKYEEIKEFSYEIVQSLFFPQYQVGTQIQSQNITSSVPNTNSNLNVSNLPIISDFCLFDSNLEKLYREEKLKINNHWEILQYVQLVFKK